MEIDFTYLETLSDGDTDFITEFVSTFEKTSINLIQKMEAELASNDFENLGKSAHQLKPSAKMLGLWSGDKLEEIQNDPTLGNVELVGKIKTDCEEGLKLLKGWARDQGIDL